MEFPNPHPHLINGFLQSTQSPYSKTFLQMPTYQFDMNSDYAIIMYKIKVGFGLVEHETEQKILKNKSHTELKTKLYKQKQHYGHTERLTTQLLFYKVEQTVN